jgi:predicted DNA-binding transcriptional regulator AlpA
MATIAAKPLSSQPSQPSPHGAALLRKSEVARLCGVSTRTIDRWQEDAEFPPPILIGKQSYRWTYDAVMTWLRTRPTGKGDVA